MEKNACSNNYLTLINIKLPEANLNTVYVQCSSLDKLLRHQIDRLDYIMNRNVWYKSYTFFDIYVVYLIFLLHLSLQLASTFSIVHWMKNRFQYHQIDLFYSIYYQFHLAWCDKIRHKTDSYCECNISFQIKYCWVILCRK